MAVCTRKWCIFPSQSRWDSSPQGESQEPGGTSRLLDKSEFDCLQKRKKPPELGALMIARRMPVGISVPKKANDGPSPRVSSSSITARLPTPDPGSAAFSDPSNGSQGLRFTVRLRRLGTVGISPFRNTVICPVFYHTFIESAMVFIGFILILQ